MSNDTETLIAGLVAGLVPARPMRRWAGLMQVTIGLGVLSALVLTYVGLRPDLRLGSFDPLFLLASGLFLMLGAASTVTAVAMAQPRVGNAPGGWTWASAMAALLPVIAVISLPGRFAAAFSPTAISEGLSCFVSGSLMSLSTFVILVAWLRRGAPTSPERAGLVAGIAASSLGVFAFSLHCPSSDIVHIGLWHGGAVALGALCGRFLVPSLIRW